MQPEFDISTLNIYIIKIFREKVIRNYLFASLFMILATGFIKYLVGRPTL